jgi:hypothetical protein
MPRLTAFDVGIDLKNGEYSSTLEAFGIYNVWNDTLVTVPDTVRRIVAFSSFFNTAIGGDGIRFVVNSKSTAPLIIDGLKIDHHASSTS